MFNLNFANYSAFLVGKDVKWGIYLDGLEIIGWSYRWFNHFTCYQPYSGYNKM